MSATPRPWRVVENQIWAGDAESLALVRELPSRPPTRAQDNADLIVRAVNAFAGLLAVAKGFEQNKTAGIIALERLDVAHPDWREWTA